MTTRKSAAHWLLSTLLSATLGVVSVACSDDDGDSKDAAVARDTGVSVDANTGLIDANMGKPDTGTSVGDGSTSSDPKVAQCLGAVYSELSDECSACACKVDTTLAPSCGKPCWDFIACSFRAQAGACATFAAGGPAMRPQFEACTMTECGAQLNVPGAQVVSAYPPIIGACAVPMGTTPNACTGDIAKFMAALPKP